MERLEQIRREVNRELAEHNITSAVIWPESKFDDVGYCNVLLMVSDGKDIELVRSVVRSAQNRLALVGIEFELDVRAKWTIVEIGEIQPLWASDGGLVAASVVSLALRAGQRTTPVQVIFTWSASKALKELAPSADLRDAAKAVVQTRLAQHGLSEWDVLQEPTIEISAAAVPYVNRQLQRAA